MKPWHGRVVAVLLIACGVIHMLKPAWLTLDWQAITVIIIGVLLPFLPLSDLGSIFDSVEFGKAKLLSRNTDKLGKATEEAVKSEELNTSAETKNSGVFVGRQRTLDHSYSAAPDEDRTSTEASTEHQNKREVSDELGAITELLQTDKELALMRISAAIEEMVDKLAEKNNIALSCSATQMLPQAAISLWRAEVITHQTTNALLEFRRVRNQIAHWEHGKPTFRTSQTAFPGNFLAAF